MSGSVTLATMTSDERAVAARMASLAGRATGSEARAWLRFTHARRVHALGVPHVCACAHSAFAWCWNTVLLPRLVGVWHRVEEMLSRRRPAVTTGAHGRAWRSAARTWHGLATVFAFATALAWTPRASAFCRTV